MTRTTTKKKNTVLKSAALSAVGLGLISLGIAIAPFVPELEWQISKAISVVANTPRIINKKINGPINRLPENADKVLTLEHMEEALSLVGQAQAAEITTQPATIVPKPTIPQTTIELTPQAPEEPTVLNARHNRVVIEKIGVDMTLVEGADAKQALSRGGWLIPGTSRPNIGGNTVIGCHRYLYTSGPKTCYHLDKLDTGDTIKVYWEGNEYTYRIEKNFIVRPDAVEILDNTANTTLTIFTCNPVYSTKERLVIKATLINIKTRKKSEI